MLLKVVTANDANGSVESLVGGTVTDCAGVTGGWANRIADSIPVTDSAIRIGAAIRKVEHDLSLDELAAPSGDGFVHGVMLGSLDVQWEVDTDNQIEPAEFDDHEPTVLLTGGTPGFASMPYDAAVREFLALKPVTRKVFDRLGVIARARAFTVAGASRESIVRTVQRELARQVARGAELRDFRDRVVPRLEQAGWTPINPSHVENVFRTGVMKAYGAGRVEYAMKPSVLAARPYWSWRGVQDGPPRQRESHQKANGFAMLATNPEWTKIYPPAGWQCRCKVVCVSQKRAGKIVYSIIGAVAPLRLVDKGFTAGVPALLPSSGQVQVPAQVQAPAPVAEPAATGTPGEYVNRNVATATPKAFKSAFDNAMQGSEFKAFVNDYPLDELAKMKLEVVEGNKAGIAIKDHGDGRIEGTALFNHGAPRGTGVALLERAAQEHGVNYVECFGETLRGFYEKAGFVVDTASDFNDAYAPVGWDYAKHGRPKYYTLKRPVAT